MKFYIPTSSHNIEDILSTESISPISYYAKRSFGAKFFKNIPYINSDNTLFLFSKIPNFQIDDHVTEQYPIALEIDDDAQLKKLDVTSVYDGDDCKIVSCSKTIILTPWNSRVIYFNNLAYKQSRVVIDMSRNCKLGLRFSWVYTNDGAPLCYMAKMINKKSLPDKGPDDMDFNAGKGAIWGYILGCYHSISPEAAQLTSISNRIRNIASNAISNSGECNQDFYNQLQDLDKRFHFIADKETNDKWSQACPQEKRIILKEYLVYEDAFNKFLTRNKLPYGPRNPNAKDYKEVWFTYREEVKAYMEAYVGKNRLASSTNPLSSITYRDGVVSIESCELINCVLDQIRLGKLDKEKIRTNRIESAKIVLSEISDKLRKRFGKERWDQNPEERDYINKLFQNISDYKPFDINSIQDEELKAIAAVLLKGEDNVALMRYLEDNCVSNYSYILCLWGAIEGYPSINKTILSPVISADNVCQVNILLGVQNTNEQFPSEVHISLVSSVKAKNITGVTNTVKEEVLPDCLKRIFNSKEFNDINPKAQPWYIEESKKVWSKHNSNKTAFQKELSALKDACKISGTKGKWESCVNLIKGVSKPKQTRSKKKDDNVIPFQDNYGEDNSPMQSQDDHFIKTLDTSRNFSEPQIKRLIANWKYTNNKHTNNSTEQLKHFINLCLQEGRGEKDLFQELKDVFTDEVAEMMKVEIERKLNKQ